MPLDTGIVSQGSIGGDIFSPGAGVDRTLCADGHVGQALRTLREDLGLSLYDIWELTRVRTSQIAAVEMFALDALPARPFVIGYVRAYAIALGLDAEAVVSRFRAEAAPVDDRLGTPPGLRYQFTRRVRWTAVLGLTTALAVLGWNILRHANSTPMPRVHARLAPATTTPLAPALMTSPTQLGAPLPPPLEANASSPLTTPAILAFGTPFVASGTVYGAPAPGSGVVLQARRSLSLIVRTSAGAVVFGRQLATGEAWRAPAMSGLVAEVSNPAELEVFLGGLSHGPMPSAQTSLSALHS